jgi:Na+-transporting NADH:ubiquinone oxidoreductase subunit NqrC
MTLRVCGDVADAPATVKSIVFSIIGFGLWESYNRVLEMTMTMMTMNDNDDNDDDEFMIMMNHIQRGS